MGHRKGLHRMSLSANVDVLIFGGGIAGLWTLARLRTLGYSAALIERRFLGGVQTPASQGIIHGGIKYALDGSASAASEAIAAMPALWRDCLAGKGELDLRAVRVLSQAQYLWAQGVLTSRVRGFFAAKALRSRVVRLTGAERPEAFRNAQFRGAVLRLDEPVLDLRSLIDALSKLCGEAVYRSAGDARITWETGATPSVSLGTENGDWIEVQARSLVLAAGSGNAELLAMLGRDRPPMQLRPLHMVMLQGALPKLHAHCLGASVNPRLTITSYPSVRGNVVWYLGGELAESGAGRSQTEQVICAQRELRELLPWIELRDVRWATLRVNRAEERQPLRRRPVDCCVARDAGVITVWPTKLAFAPRAVARVLDSLRQLGISPQPGNTEPLAGLPRPAQAPLPWEAEEKWI